MTTTFGFIETKGLVAAIAVADKITKNCRISLIGKEVTPPSYVTIKFSGEKEEVEAALKTGEEKAREMGAFIAKLFISSPHEELSKVIGDFNTGITEEIKKLVKPEIVKPKEKKSKIDNPSKDKTEFEPQAAEIEKHVETISRLKEQALDEQFKTGENGINDTGIEKKMSGGTLPPDEDLVKLNVHQLRKLARSYSNFPIKGREISRANRTELLDFFNSIS